MNKRILGAAACAVILLSSCTAQESARPVSTAPTPTPFTEETASAGQETEFEPFEDQEAGTEAPTGANLQAVQNFAGTWNLMMENTERLQLKVSEAQVYPGTGMLEGGQVFEHAFGAGTLYVYVLEGHVVGARMECHTNAWRNNADKRDWSTLWKTMIRSTNGNWATSTFTEIVSKLSSGFMPAGQETGTTISEIISDSGWVYQMVDEDLGYEFVKTVSCWLSQFYGAAGRPLPTETAEPADAD